ncbi:hypothetical protein SAMN05216199_3323 [Pedococcus cremeus]|uniref:Uncharacterized protein n=1 Tax=Pedococcus cremeus TaxID=587636 RepID=A0A1H9X1F2_9MICO|nr:hypothetical protein SAMN05216199_3323 [Pedococcus cremeus]
MRALPTWGTSLVAAVVVLGPALLPGFVLVGDMVFVPKLPLNASLLGIGAAAPRAVPSDLVVALAGSVLPGQLVQKLVLLALLVAAGAGAARVVPLRPLAAAAVALAYVWNPFVAERLAIGQWAVLAGYAALPWVVRGCWRLGLQPTSSGRAASAAIVLGSLGGAPAWLLVVLGAVPAYVTGAVSRTGAAEEAGSGGRARALGRRAVLLALLLVATALPWAVPAVARPGGTVGDPLGATVFTPHADTAFGVLFSLLTGGGVWNGQVVPPGRLTVVGSLMAAALLLISLAGLVLGLRRRTPGAAAVTVVGGLGLLVATATAVPLVADAMAGLPGGGLLRDGSRQVAPWVLATSVGLGLAIEALASTVARPGRVLVVLVGLLPVAALPAAGWGVSGRLVPTQYPADYAAVARMVDAADGAVAVLPFEAYRRFPWNGHRSSLQPLPRFLSAVTVSSSDLVVRQPSGAVVRVPGEDRLATEVAAALRSGSPTSRLGQLGVRWVVVDVDGAAPPAGTVERYAGSRLRLYEVPVVDPVAAADPARRWQPPWLVVLWGDLLAVVVVVVLVAGDWGRATGGAPKRPDSRCNADTVQ